MGALVRGSAAPADLMTGAPPFGSDRLVTLENWQDPPGNRWAFQHVRELIPTARIKRGGGTCWELPRASRDVLGLDVVLGDGNRATVGQILAATQTDGFLVLHRGRIVAEHYFNGMQPDTPHLLMSVSKSIIGAVAGRLAGTGKLDVTAQLTTFVPELDGTSFRGATVQQLLDMRTGTRFDEDYDDLAADVRAYEQVYLWRPRTDADMPADAISYFATLRNDGEHGGAFRYRSILTDVLAWVLERAAGARLHELVSGELWEPMGAEFDAEITLDGHGNPMADGGICATLRDLGRFGLQYLSSPHASRPPVVPVEWVEDTVRGAPDGAEAFRAGDGRLGFPGQAHYRNCWWVHDPGAPFFYGAGIYGQNVFVHEPTETVAVKLSTWPRPLDQQARDVTIAAVITVGRSL
jgi:CubicO group peptidase (beta-lactamase class C family)